LRQIQCESWLDFAASMSRYCRLQRARRDEFWFRGQGDNSFGLQASIDREFQVADDAGRQQTIRSLLEEFQREAIRLQFDDRFTGDIDRLELLARHHGLPSPLLDWTQSPFVAAYFAFAASTSLAKAVSVWMLDLSRIEENPLDFELINDLEKIEGNPRALKQKGVFLRVTSVRAPIEVLLGESLFRFDIPIGCKDEALAELDEMMVNGTYLYYDLNGAADTAKHRIGAGHGSS